MATMWNRSDFIYLLLDAGADLTLADWAGRVPIDVARSDAAMALLIATMFRDPATRDADALAYLDGRRIPWRSPRPEDETALTSTIDGGLLGFPGPPPPPAPPPCSSIAPAGSQRSVPLNDRMQVLMRMGADPNRRLTWQGVDWTPLAVAISRCHLSEVRTLLENGADPNARWCITFELGRPYRPRTSPADCTTGNGITPLMAAAAVGGVGQVLLLLEHGANPLLRDWRGRTAVEYAEGGNTAVIRTLRAAAAAGGGARYRGSS
jgi:hypothetical protein